MAIPFFPWHRAFMGDLFKKVFGSWQTTTAGVLAGALTAWAAIPGLDQKPLSQQLAAFGSALAVALVGILAKDRTPPKDPQ